MARIRVTGYIDTADLDPDRLDGDDRTGLSEQGYLDLVADENGTALKLSDLTDIDLIAE